MSARIGIKVWRHEGTPSTGGQWTKMNIVFLGLILGGFLTPPSSQAATGLAFLQLGGSVRTSGLGGNGTAVADHSGAIFGNPSGMANLPQSDLAVMHSTWIEQMTIDTVTVALPTSWGTVGLGAFWLSTPGLERRGPGREFLGTFGATSWSGALSYATEVGQFFSFGMNFKMIGDILDDRSVLGWAVDVGGQWQTPIEGLTVGLMVQHLGPSVTYVVERTALPTTWVLGGAYQISAAWWVVADGSYQPAGQGATVQVGTELTPYGPLTLRMGYRVGSGQSMHDQAVIGTFPLLTGFVGGVGLAFGDQTLDFAVVPVPGFGLTHRLGLRAGW